MNDLEITNNFNGSQIKFQFPVDLGVPQGEIHFFCPSDSKLDFRIPIKADSEYQQFISTEQLKSGLWRIKVDWQAGGQPYFKELALAL